MKKYLIIIAILFLLPNIINAQVILSEIMFNPDGSDSGREWIEIQNLSQENIDIINYKLLENNVNHKITAFQGGSLLNTNEYAVIADNAEKFLLDYPDYEGILFDSAFSLANTGEDLKMINSNGNIDDEFFYNPEIQIDAKHSLQFNGEIWISNIPTPGNVNSSQNGSISSDSDDSGSTDDSSGNGDGNGDISTHNSQIELSNYVPKQNLEISIGRDRKIGINTPVIIEPSFNVDDLGKLKYHWNLGNGSYRKGAILEYSYKKPGIYNVILDVLSKNEQAISRIKVYVIEINVDILFITSGKDVDVKLINRSNSEINLGDYQIIFGKNEFILPKNTILDENAEIIIGQDVTGFKLENIQDLIDSPLRINYPNGEVLSSYLDNPVTK